MDLKLRNRVAIIGGSSKGLGRGCAAQLAREGVNVVICSNESDSLLDATECLKRYEVEVLPLNVDMSSREDNERIFNETMERFGRIDILINNSGGPPAGSLVDL